MSLYQFFVERLFWATLSGSTSLAAALLFARYAPVRPLLKVWALRAALVSSVLAFFSIGFKAQMGVSGAADGRGPSLIVLSLIVGTWLAGVLTVGAKAVGAIRWTGELLRCSERAGDPQTRAIASSAADLAGLRAAPEVRVSKLVRTVMLVFGRRSVVLIPSESLDVDQLLLAMTHEMAHVKHRDLLWVWTAVLAETLLWFNPFVYWAGQRLRLQQEVAADHCAISCSQSAPRRYAEMLLSFACPTRPYVGATGVSNTLDLQARLRALQKQRSVGPLGTACCCVALGLCVVPWRPAFASGRQEVAAELRSPTSSGIAAPMRIASP